MSNWETTQALLASSAQTASGAGAAIDLGTRDRLLRQTLAVTAASGTTPSLAVRLECSADGITGWRTFGTFAATAVAIVEKVNFVSPERFVRVAWTITGTTPSFTFGVTGTRGIAYANLEQLDALGLPAQALAPIAKSKQAEMLATVTERMSSKLGLRYDLPLQAWGLDIAEACAKISGYELLATRGFNPDGADAEFSKRNDKAWEWLDEVADSKANPIDIVDSTPTVADDGVVVVTFPSRGWR